MCEKAHQNHKSHIQSMDLKKKIDALWYNKWSNIDALQSSGCWSMNQGVSQSCPSFVYGYSEEKFTTIKPID